LRSAAKSAKLCSEILAWLGWSIQVSSVEVGIRYAVSELMDLLDLIKATVVCALLAFVCYSYHRFAQGVVIGSLALIWLGYARKTVMRLRQR
jgi:hypothetical protein